MTAGNAGRKPDPESRVLVISSYFVPCREVGGKRFTFLSRYLSKWCADYHVLTRHDKARLVDDTAFTRQVHRVRMFPYYPPIDPPPRGLRHLLLQGWIQWLCFLDPGSGFVIPAAVKGVRLCRKYRLNVVVVTVPDASSIVAATIVSKMTGARLIIDYRDPWTNHHKIYPKLFGRRAAEFFERAGIRQAAAIVLCSDIMRDQFVQSFGDIAPRCVEVIYNGFEAYEEQPEGPSASAPTTMIYAGNFYGNRRLSLIAPALAKMLQAGEITAASFQFQIFSKLLPEDYALIEQLGLETVIKVQEPVSYREIKKLMSESDILFLPSGDDVVYAVPFKFFDYLSARRPVLAVAPAESGVSRLMQQVDCGEFAAVNDSAEIYRSLQTMIRKERVYSFDGSQRFLWKNAAAQYQRIIEQVSETSGDPNSGPENRR